MAGEFLAFGYELYIGAGTTSSSYPSAVGSLVKVYNLTNAPLAGTSNSTSILDYDSDGNLIKVTDAAFDKHF